VSSQYIMGHLTIRKALLLTAMCGALAGLTGCGERTVPPPTSTTMATENADAVAAATISQMAGYTTALEGWSARFAELTTGWGRTALDFADPMRPTDDEMGRAQEFIEAMRSSVAELKTIEPPPEVAQAHAQLRAALGGQITALERLVSAFDWGSERDAQLAYRQHEESLALLMQAAKDLEPYVDLSEVTQN